MADILYIEDNVDLRESVLELFSLYDYEVKAAASAEEAWGLLNGGLKVKLVITDQNLPNMSGLELAKRIKEAEISTISELPIILLTSNFDASSTREIAANLGVSSVVGKPFNADALISLISELLEKSCMLAV